MRNDKITDHEDWKDGMNIFRHRVLESLVIINEDLKIIKQKLKETL